MLKNIQKEVEDLRVKVYSGQSNEDTEKALYEIEQLLFKAMDKQLILSGVSHRRELLNAFAEWLKKDDDHNLINQYTVDAYLEII
tara:strand:+ start:1983 stop:2237 length:255 start_codon:yes stop_codon:yes gene_type:complete